MTDDDPDAGGTPARSNVEASTTDALDPEGTRAPEADDPFATWAEAPSATWPDSFGEPSRFGGFSPASPRFRILRPHARGALGEVFVALDEELRREVALKEIQDRHADDPCSRARFLLEAEVTGSLEHPGIVPVYGLGRYPDGRPYYAMRLIRGGSLKTAIDRHYRPETHRADPSERAVEFRTLLRRFVDVCNAIGYAHSRQVLHRDLKPGNVMLGPYGETLVVDWGLAKSLASGDGGETCHDGPLRPLSGESSATVVGSVVGTPSFMSPEQAEGDLDRLGPASDIYSLGATLYCMMTGRAPFNDPEVGEVIAKVRRGEFPPPRQVRRDVPRALQAICLKAMALRPEDRYPTAKALAGDVEHWLAGASVSAAPDGLAVRLWRWCRRRPVLTTAAVACVFFDLCSLVLFLLLYVQSVLHAGTMPQWNMAAGVLVLLPFAAQVGAFVGSVLGAALGGVLRRTLSGLHRGASVGLKFGVPVAVCAWLASAGIFGIARAPRLTEYFFPKAATTVTTDTDWPRLPGAVTECPDWIKPGGPFDVAAFFEDPPIEDNAAPLYLDALFEFDEEMASCFSPSEGSRRGAIARYRKERFERLEAAMREAPSSVDRSDLDNLLEDYEVGFLKLKQAQRRPRCVFRTGLGIEARLPHAQAAWKLARVAVLRARRQIERGEVDRAIESLDRLFRLARDLRPRGYLINQLVGTSIESLAGREILLPILREPDLRVAQCDSVLAILNVHSSSSLDPFVEGFQTEYIGLAQTVHGLVDRLILEEHFHGSRLRNVLRPLMSQSSLFRDFDPDQPAIMEALEARIDAQLSQTTPAAFADSSRLALDDYHRAVIDLARLPVRERLEPADRLRRTMLADHPLLLYCSLPSSDFLKSIGKSDASAGAMKCLVALRRWELVGQGAPTDLEAVVRAAGMANVPLDPFRPDGGPLRMIVLDGGPVVYSVGLDGIDDGGLLDAKPGNDSKGDYLYRLKPAVSDR